MPAIHLDSGAPWPMMRAHGYTMSMHSKGPRSFANVALFHYVTKSANDFQTKLRRGGGDGKNKVEGWFEETAACAILPACL